MKRRQFFATTAAASLGALAGCRPDSGRETATRAGNESEPAIRTLGGQSLEELRDSYRTDLLERYFPNNDRYVVDHEYGGFMTTVDIHSGERLSSDKRSWYEGRGMWVYSFMYNYIEPDPAFLEVARKSKDFIVAHRPEADRFWPRSFSREGQPLDDEEGDIYGSLFIAEGLGEYAVASGEEQYFELAKQIMLNCMDRYDSRDYEFPVGYLSPDAPVVLAPRILGHWMVFLIGSTNLLQHHDDPQIEQIADRCVDAIMNHHMNSRFQLLNEVLAHDLSLPGNEFDQFAYMGHGIETIWMVMYEAIRRRDAALFRESADAFKRHVEVARDPVYGGYFRSLDHVDEYRWKVDKVLWLQEEILIGSLLLLEHTGDPWAKQCFEETDAYVRDTFIHPDYKFWIHSGNRTLDEYSGTRVEHYHHPRHLMFNLLAVERMIERSGRVSDVLI